MSIVLSDEQEAATARIFDFLGERDTQTISMQGLAGTGKTTVLAEIAADVPTAILCTLTGKAASVLRRKTGLPACTVHSAFYQLEEARKDQRGRNVLRFKVQHERGQLADKIVLLDESSMLNRELALDIINTGAKIVACGDPGQLPPVTGKRFFLDADIELKTIHRQALESSIIRQAHRVRRGEHYLDDGDAFRVLKRPLTDEEVVLADVILCFTNATKDAANWHARTILGYIHPAPREGEPVMCMRNAPQFGIFNGAVYTLEQPFLEGDHTIHIDVDGKSVAVPFVVFRGLKSAVPDHVEPTTSFDFGYAMTVHKAQGSEWSNVVLIDEYFRREERSAWLYTAISRAADKIAITPYPPGYREPPKPDPLPF
jgi:exodeoxyribonuclease-5